MHYVFLLTFLFFVTPAAAQVKIDNGVRSPQAVVVSGNSVIDDDNKTDYEIKLPVEETEEEKQLQKHPTDDVSVGNPVLPETPVLPSDPTPKKNVKRVVKKYEVLKVQRSIADDRIDDAYVQEMLKNNTLFTPGAN